ncbi:hypothetical protein DERF_001558 [Dermatophagoides farinae]|uniref:Uncharacterized protein n=1 Tax=Dermatophagoides farinae TaxID=6954 RepID=A0A922IDZ0_DERFA|nr:hypothetical protein DERF_001558 [Dermatophagoides farinae]
MITTTNITVDGDGVDDEKDIKAKKKCDGSLLFDDPRLHIQSLMVAWYWYPILEE